MTKFTIRILQADVPSVNGRLYPKHVLEAAITKKPSQLFAQFGMPADSMVDPTDVAAAVDNLKLDGEYLTAEINVLATPKGEILAKLLAAHQELDYRLAGNVIVDSAGVVWDLNFISIGILPKGDGASRRCGGSIS